MVATLMSVAIRNEENMKNKIGDRFHTIKGDWFEIIEYNNSKDIKIKFDNGEIRTVSSSRIGKNCNILKPSEMNNIKKMEKHGDRYTKLWKEWNTMLWRCNPKNKRHHKWYSDKGIKVCDEWQRYIVFKEWALQNGFEEHLTIDRINHNKNYCPENCRWITQEENVLDSTLVPVEQYNLNNELIKKFRSRSEASKETNVSLNIIDRSCKHKRRKCDKYRWEYANK